MYVIKLTCAKVDTHDGDNLVREGTVTWLVKSDYFPTFTIYPWADLIVFPSREIAEEAIVGHNPKPWYYQLGELKIVEVEPIYQSVIKGYKEC